jgi:hypothetical protein
MDQRRKDFELFLRTIGTLMFILGLGISLTLMVVLIGYYGIEIYKEGNGEITMFLQIYGLLFTGLGLFIRNSFTKKD